MAMVSLGRLDPEYTALFICDIQERFAGSVKHFNEVVLVTNRLIEAAELLNMPIIFTEQYPKGLGPTVAQLKKGPGCRIFEKTKFSMAIPEVDLLLKTSYPKVNSIILCGLETHVCILQTTIDFVDKGMDVHVIADAVGSRSDVDRHFALSRMRKIGAVISTSETALLQLAGDSMHPQFKALQSLIKELPPEMGLLKSGL